MHADRQHPGVQQGGVGVQLLHPNFSFRARGQRCPGAEGRARVDRLCCEAERPAANCNYCGARGGVPDRVAREPAPSRGGRRRGHPGAYQGVAHRRRRGDVPPAVGAAAQAPRARGREPQA
eukprot:2688190-Pyramimonas_sp.AAC.1